MPSNTVLVTTTNNEDKKFKQLIYRLFTPYGQIRKISSSTFFDEYNQIRKKAFLIHYFDIESAIRAAVSKDQEFSRRDFTREFYYQTYSHFMSDSYDQSQFDHSQMGNYPEIGSCLSEEENLELHAQSLESEMEKNGQLNFLGDFNDLDVGKRESVDEMLKNLGGVNFNSSSENLRYVRIIKTDFKQLDLL